MLTVRLFLYGEKQLEIEKVGALAQAKRNFDAKMRLSLVGREDITWWLKEVKSSCKPILDQREDFVLYSDASSEGWGAHIGQEATGGRWSEQDSTFHINALGL